ncbi:MAG: hypothetical protein CL917_00825 [Deltaproteobacteria bacterium]|nr:hypothetical protein [Deltaproteobacteria bacterium]
MRLSRILMYQIALEVSTYTVLGFTAATAILLGQNMVRRLDALTAIGLTNDDLHTIISALVLTLAPYALPIALLFGCLLTMRRMGSDGETLVMQASGMGVGSFLLPITVIGLLTSLVSGYLMISVEHNARLQILDVIKQIAMRGGRLEPGQIRGINYRQIYVEERNRLGELKGVMIIDHSRRSGLIEIFAEYGRVFFDDSTHFLHFELKNGDIHFPKAGGRHDMDSRLSFDDFDYSFDISEIIGRDFSATRPRQMSLSQLTDFQERIQAGKDLGDLHERDPIEYSIERQRRFAFSTASLIFAVLSVALGRYSIRGGRASGIALCIAIAGGYYLAFMLSVSLAQNRILPPSISLWLPNIVYAGLALSLIFKNEKSAP